MRLSSPAIHARSGGKGIDPDLARDSSHESVTLYKLLDIERGNAERGTTSEAGYADVNSGKMRSLHADVMTPHGTSQKGNSDEYEKGEGLSATFSYDVYPSLLTIECRRVPQSQSHAQMKTQTRTPTPSSSSPLGIDNDSYEQSRYQNSRFSSSSSPLSTPLSLPAPIPSPVSVTVPVRRVQKSKTLWGEYLDPASGIKYYHNRLTKETTWDQPSSKELLKLLPVQPS